VHYDLPKNIESYYQEIGRAGRDGLRADCLLLYSQADLYQARKHIADGAASERRGRHARLKAMLDYAEALQCRRKRLLGYFGEAAANESCGFCDTCLAQPVAGAAALVDVTAEARLVLDTICATGEMYGSAYIVDILRGSRSSRVTGRQHDRLSQHGSGRRHSARFWRELIDQLVSRAVLVRDPQYGGLSLTDAGREVLRGAIMRVPFDSTRQVGGPKPTRPEPTVEATRPGEKLLSSRSAEVGQLFIEGQTLTQLMAAYQVQARTILSHLERCIQEGWRLPPERVLAMSQLPAGDRQAVLEKFGELGGQRLTPVFEALGGRISYDDLRILRLYHRLAG
jgi:ATP-dependent DNA helicase RecQ